MGIENLLPPSEPMRHFAPVPDALRPITPFLQEADSLMTRMEEQAQVG